MSAGAVGPLRQPARRPEILSLDSSSGSGGPDARWSDPPPLKCRDRVRPRTRWSTPRACRARGSTA